MLIKLLKILEYSKFWIEKKTNISQGIYYVYIEKFFGMVVSFLETWCIGTSSGGNQSQLVSRMWK